MSESWHDYGFGICTSNLKEEISLPGLMELISQAPELKERVNTFMNNECGGAFKDSYDLLTSYVEQYGMQNLNYTNAVTLICGNHKGDQSHPMKLQQGPHSLFFSCPEYKSIYGDDHEGRSCNNRLTLVDYEKLLDYLTERTYAGDGLQETNLTGLKFTLKGVDYEVLEHTKDKYRVLMLNRKAISK